MAIITADEDIAKYQVFYTKSIITAPAVHTPPKFAQKLPLMQKVTSTTYAPTSDRYAMKK
jgi:hypothetical protein